MTNKEIFDGNRLIADFMQREYLTPKEGDTLLFDYRSNTVDYDSDWSDIMPVAYKIAHMNNWNFSISLDEAVIYDDDYKHTASGRRFAYKSSDWIMAVWVTVVEFVKYYNSQTK